MNRAMCLLGLLMWAFLPASVIVAVWQEDWRWVVSGLVVAVTGIPVAWLGVQGVKAQQKRKTTP